MRMLTILKVIDSRLGQSQGNFDQDHHWEWVEITDRLSIINVPSTNQEPRQDRAVRITHRLLTLTGHVSDLC